MQTVRGTNVPPVVLSIVLIGAPIRRLSVILYSNPFVSLSRISRRRLRHRALEVRYVRIRYFARENTDRRSERSQT